jgi:hypothetical protein
MKTIKLSKPSPAVIDAVERERYEIVKEITKMMFQDDIGAKGVIALAQVAEMIRKRAEW